jgi:DNA repair protein RadC
MAPNRTDRRKTPPTKNKAAALVAVARELLSAFPNRECFGVLLFNSRGRLTDAELVHVGTLDQSLVHPREVFRLAILKPAAAIVVGHYVARNIMAVM